MSLNGTVWSKKQKCIHKMQIEWQIVKALKARPRKPATAARSLSEYSVKDLCRWMSAM